MSINQVRDISTLNKLAQVLLNAAITDIKKEGIDPLIVETQRTQERQNYLYCQGRTVTQVIAKGIKKDFAQKYCNPATTQKTWTLNSDHKDGKAVDIVPQRLVNGKMQAIWNAKDTQTKRIIAIMELYGFEAGANWTKNVDSPHFQIKGNYTNIFTRTNTNKYITKMVQRALKITADGIWGNNTDKAVSSFRKEKKYKKVNPMIGATALKTLIKRL